MAKEPAGAGPERQGTRWLRLAVVTAVLVGALLVYRQLWGPGSDGGDDKPPRPADLGDGTLVDEEPEDVTTTFAVPGEPVEPTCPEMDGSSPREVSFASPPPMCIDPAKTYLAVVQTNRGYFEITMDAARAPNTVNNFVFLALWHYYDGVGLHRIIPDFVVQGGDAIGPRPGFGGPGYEFADELPTEPPFYPEMAVAMANSGANTNGSQFFIIVGPQGEELPPLYSRFGTVTAGTPIVDEIEETGNPQGTPPRDVTVIQSIEVFET